jgi:hypothetical protein
VLFPKVRDASPATLLLADGFSCRSQIEQGTGRQAQHLAQVIRDALPDRPAAELDEQSPLRRQHVTLAAFGAAAVVAAGAAAASATRRRARA